MKRNITLLREMLTHDSSSDGKPEMDLLHCMFWVWWDLKLCGLSLSFLFQVCANSSLDTYYNVCVHVQTTLWHGDNFKHKMYHLCYRSFQAGLDFVVFHYICTKCLKLHSSRFFFPVNVVWLGLDKLTIYFNFAVHCCIQNVTF